MLCIVYFIFDEVKSAVMSQIDKLYIMYLNYWGHGLAKQIPEIGQIWNFYFFILAVHVSGFPPYLKNLEFCHLLFQAWKMSGICSKSKKSLEFFSKPGGKKPLEFKKFGVSRLTFQHVFTKNIIYIYIISKLSTSTLIHSKFNLRFNCFYLEITWKIHGISCHQRGGNPNILISWLTMLNVIFTQNSVIIYCSGDPCRRWVPHIWTSWLPWLQICKSVIFIYLVFIVQQYVTIFCCCNNAPSYYQHPIFALCLPKSSHVERLLEI